jgi:hypothetical protein
MSLRQYALQRPHRYVLRASLGLFERGLFVHSCPACVRLILIALIVPYSWSFTRYTRTVLLCHSRFAPRRRPSDTARARHVTSALERGYKLARPRKAFFWPAFVTRLLTPRSRKSGYGLLWGCRSPLILGLLKNFFLTKFQFEPKNRENLHSLFWPTIAIDRAWSN